MSSLPGPKFWGQNFLVEILGRYFGVEKLNHSFSFWTISTCSLKSSISSSFDFTSASTVFSLFFSCVNSGVRSFFFFRAEFSLFVFQNCSKKFKVQSKFRLRSGRVPRTGVSGSRVSRLLVQKVLSNRIRTHGFWSSNSFLVELFLKFFNGFVQLVDLIFKFFRFAKHLFGPLSLIFLINRYFRSVLITTSGSSGRGLAFFYSIFLWFQTLCEFDFCEFNAAWQVNVNRDKLNHKIKWLIVCRKSI